MSAAADAAALPAGLRRVTVVGAGKSGLAAANALARRGADVRLVEARERDRPEGLEPAVTFVAGAQDVRPGDAVVLSPGIKACSPLREAVAADASEVLGEVELFVRLTGADALAITGTDGKSTTTTMLGAIALAAGRTAYTGGNLGNPLCAALDDLSTSHFEAPARPIADSDLVVAEVSAFQLTTCATFRPKVAVVTNLKEDHLDYFGADSTSDDATRAQAFEAYQASKRAIWRALGAGDVVVLNRDDAVTRAWEDAGLLPAGEAAPTIRWFSAAGDPAAEARLADGELLVGGHALMTRAELPLLGAHNVANALAAALAARAYGLPLDAARTALMAYQPLVHRLEIVATVEGVRWVNDSKATNPNAALAGLSAVAEDGPLVALVGGSDKGSDFSGLAEALRSQAKRVVAFGQTGDLLVAAIGDAGPPVTRVAGMADALAFAAEHADAGDTVLLSPGCASFDEFRGYDHRGDVFREWVLARQRMRLDDAPEVH